MEIGCSVLRTLYIETKTCARRITVLGKLLSSLDNSMLGIFNFALWTSTCGAPKGIMALANYHGWKYV
jgi:hypothetical protein